MRAKNRAHQLTEPLLREYRDAALVNSHALLEEAAVLLAQDRLPRAYFLAACSIEESGKAVQAFEGLAKNLKDSAVTQRLKLQFEDHSQKVTAAFSPWLQSLPDIRAEVMQFVEWMVYLKFGREASMYTDINAEVARVTTPQMQVSPLVAADCVRLAGAVLAYVRPYVQGSKPKATTPAQDNFFAMRPSTFQRMANTPDFWEYYVSQMEKGDTALESAAVEYQRLYASAGKLFTAVDGEPNDGA